MPDKYWFLIVIGTTIAIVAVGALEACIVMWAWNFFMAGIFHFATITFWPAFGLMVVCNILFKSRVSKD